MIKLFCGNYWQNPKLTASVYYFQKQPSEVFYKKRCSVEVCKYHMKIPVLESVFKKVAGLGPTTLLQRNSNTGVFCEICEIFKNPYLEEHLRTAASILSL